MYIQHYFLIILSIAFKLLATISDKRISRHALDVIATVFMLVFCVASELRIGYLLTTALFAFQVQFLFLVIPKDIRS